MTEDRGNGGIKLLRRGVAGSVIAALCCFTPLLVWGLVGAGLGGIIGGLDFVLFPLLFTGLGVVAQALYIMGGRQTASPKRVILGLVVLFSIGIIWLEFRYALRLSLLAALMVAAYWLYLGRPGRGIIAGNTAANTAVKTANKGH